MFWGTNVIIGKLLRPTSGSYFSLPSSLKWPESSVPASLLLEGVFPSRQAPWPWPHTTVLSLSCWASGELSLPLQLSDYTWSLCSKLHRYSGSQVREWSLKTCLEIVYTRKGALFTRGEILPYLTIKFSSDTSGKQNISLKPRHL